MVPIKYNGYIMGLSIRSTINITYSVTMVIQYDKYPILQFFNKNLLPKLNGKIKLREEDIIAWNTHPDAARTAQYVVNEMYQGYIADRCGNNIYILTEKYIDALNRSEKAFRNISRGLELDKLFEDCCIIVGNYVFIGYKLTTETFFGWSLSRYTDINNYLVSLYFQGKTNDYSKNNDIVYLGSILLSRYGDKEYMFETALLSSFLNLDANKDENLQLIADKFLGMLIFKHYAKVELDMVKGNEKKVSSVVKEKITNKTITNVQVMDSQWYTSIFRNEGFTVRGYFKLQPKKNNDGVWIKELIYVNEYQKHGYHKHAKILDDPTAEPDVSELNEKLLKLSEEGFEIRNK